MTTLAELINRFFEEQQGMISANTVQRYTTTTNDLLNFLGDRPIDDIALADLNRWRTSLFDRGLARPTVESYIRVIRRLYNWSLDTGIITEQQNTARRLKKPHLERGEPKAATVEDLIQVLKAMATAERWGLETMASITRDRAAILLLADSACRVGGLCSITKSRLDLPSRRAMVREKGKGGSKPRLVFFGRATAEALSAWLYFHPTWDDGPESSRDPPLFVGLFNHQRGQWLKPQGVYQVLRRRATSAGIHGRFTPHSLRHAAAREWLRTGADLATVSQLMGHTSIKTTADHYAIWAQEELAGRHQEFGFIDPLLSPG